MDLDLDREPSVLHYDDVDDGDDDDDFDVEITTELGLRCPRCSLPTLQRRKHLQIEVDICAGCHGIWLDRGELAAVLNFAIVADRYMRDLHDDGDAELVSVARRR